MKTIDAEIIKQFGKLTESEKKDVIALIKNMAAMTKEQRAMFCELAEKTIKTIPEGKLNRTHSFFMRYAAEAIREGATLPELLEEWQEYKQESDPVPAQEKQPKSCQPPPCMQGNFTWVWDKSPIMQMLACNTESMFLGDPEVQEVWKVFNNLAEPQGSLYRLVMHDDNGINMLYSFYTLGLIHGIRKERARHKRGKGHGTAGTEPAGK